LRIFLFSLLLSMLIPATVSAQDPSTYKMDLVRAAWVGSEHPYMVVVFKITPTVPDFKLVLSMRLTYDIGDGEKILDIQKTTNARMSVYGNNVQEKSLKLYNFVKDKVDLNADKDLMLLQIDLRKISAERVARMKLKYGLWEGENSEVRHEKEYDFAVEDLTRAPAEQDR
jgi:hypothetical protein